MMSLVDEDCHLLGLFVQQTFTICITSFSMSWGG